MERAAEVLEGACVLHGVVEGDWERYRGDELLSSCVALTPLSLCVHSLFAGNSCTRISIAIYHDTRRDG